MKKNVRLFLFLVLFTTILTGDLAIAAETYCNGKPKLDHWGFYYPNGKPVKDHWGTYYPDGRAMFDHWGLYYPNGRIIKDHWGTYYPNGRIIFDHWGCYSSNGTSLQCGNGTFRTRAKIEGFGSVLIQVSPKTDKLGLFEFTTKLDTLETIITVDFAGQQVVDVEAICE